jgi:predicted nucleic acid-binding protein
MQVAKWGNSLAVRLPSAVVEALKLKKGTRSKFGSQGIASSKSVAITVNSAHWRNCDSFADHCHRVSRLVENSCMNARPFFDTTVLVYVVAQHDERTAASEALLDAGGIVSVQVLNELAAVAHRKLKMPWDAIAEALLAIRVLCPDPVPLTVETHEAGLRIASRYGFHIYDALIVAAALDAECALLYSEDLRSEQIIDGTLTIRNPFTH